MQFIFMLSKELLEILACPKCKGSLRYKKDELVCNRCRLRYKVIDGIPNMLIDEAEKF
jgi:uncharacterized protein YbaR (Trm112 family)